MKTQNSLRTVCFLAMACCAAGVQSASGDFVLTDIGNPAVTGLVSQVSGGFDLTASGSDIGATNTDQCSFDYVQRTNDFDVKVRLAGMSLSDSWAKAALMARADLTPGSFYAASVATPDVSGCLFQYRASTNPVPASMMGSFPVTYPSTWLRLQRVGNTFTAYAGLDGNTWALLGSAAVSLPATVYVGLAAASRNVSQTTVVQVRDFQNVSGGTVASITLPREPLGPSSRRTGLAISEIMYHPRTIPGMSNSLEFIEIYNSQAFFENISGYRISGSVDYTFPANTVMQSGSYLVIARDPVAVQNYYHITGVLGPWNGAETNSLPGGSGTVRLRSRAGAVLLEVPYVGGNPWPIAADGAGHSLVLSRPSYGEGDARAWSASDTIDGSPGQAEPFSTEPLRNVVINEFLAHTEPGSGLEDYLELYNHSAQAVDISGAILTDEAGVAKFHIPSGTILPAHGFTNYSEGTLGFALSAGGERIYLINPAGTRVIDAVDYDNQANGRSTGRVPDGSPYFYPLAQRTPGLPNGTRWMSPVVINELMYSPITGNDDDEYVELYNRSTNTVNLSDWRLADGISFTFPTNTMLAPDSYLVIARNVTNLFAHYPGVLSSANTLGNYSGKLANGGERVALNMPDLLVSTNGMGGFVTNTIHVLACDVTYDSGGRWGTWAAGGGSSLELVDPNADTRLAANWADSDETAKAANLWTNIEFAGPLGESLGGTVNDRLQIFMLGIGECLIDEVEVRNGVGVSAGPNLVLNPGFESGITNWTPQGSHDFSTIENAGYAGSKSLHVRAASRGDNGANRITTTTNFVGSALVTSPVTFRAKARWVRGWPEVLLRIHGGTAEAVGRLPLPTNLGTPGQANSRRIPNAGPAIYDVSHAPALPQGGETVVVTAKANDPNGLGALRLRYRVDAGNIAVTPALFTSVNMVDDGTGPDAIAGDGIYSASIPGQPANTVVTFYVEAVDSLGATNLFPQDVFPQPGFDRCFPNDAPTRECVVRWGEIQMPGSFATYHLWLSFASSNRWARRGIPLDAPNVSGLNNAEMDGTFVYNNSRVVYNALPLYAGSPWHRRAMTNGMCSSIRVDFVMNFPTDDRMLGNTDFVLNNPGNPDAPGPNTSDTSAQTEQTSYIIFRELGLVYNHRRYVHYFINGSQRSTTGQRTGNFIFEDSQQPNGDMISEWFPDDTGGELFKIEDWFEFPDNGFDFSNNNDADLTRRTIALNNQQTLVITPYRFMFRKRAVGPGDNTGDYSKFFSLVDAVSPASNPNSTTVDPAAMNSVADYDQWMRIMAVQHAVGNWDSYGYERGKNDYTYKPEHGTFQQMTWDIDFTMGVGGHGTTMTIFDTNDPRVGAMWNTPAIVRSFYRGFLDIVNGPMNNAFMDPILDAKQAALLANNINVDPAIVAGTIKPYISGRRTFLLGLLGPATPAFNINGTTNNFSVSNNLLIISGVASVAIKDIAVNGVIYPVTWGGTQTAPTAWTVRVALDAGTNQIVVEGLAPDGTVVTGASKTLSVNYTGPTARPEQSIVFNEIMYNPVIPNTSYVELYDNSDVSFDLSGWRINGLDYTFPRGSVIAGRGFLTLAKSRTALIGAFSSSNSVLQVFGEFPGNLDPDGETLTLIKPGATPAQDLIVSKVRYEPNAPWPASANGLGTALQLIDPSQDPARVGNWGDGTGWRFFSITGNIGGSSNLLGTNVVIFVQLAGEAYVDDISLVPLSGPLAGSNVVVNGDFETLPLRNTWFVPNTMTNSDVTTTYAHSGSYSLHVVNTNAGSLANNIRQALPPINTNIICTLSFWYHTTTSTNLTVRTVGGSALQGAVKQIPIGATPSATNATLASIPLIPPLWLNEVQPNNATGPTDGFGERDPWIELYNSGTNVLSLDGYYLANGYGNLSQWAFPAGKTINPGQFIVIWADGQPEQSTATEWHTSFRLNDSTGSVALAHLVLDYQLVDYLNYSGLTADQAYGDFPDGQPFERGKLEPTPGTNNVPRPVYVKINEWVASNQAGPGGYPDPADGKYDDWFELYNADLVNPADISGFYLTDSSANPLQFHIPKGTIIPAGGFLLVWADNDTGENGAGTNGDLHANFNLSKAGEAIGLYAAYDTNIVQLDYITFGGQTTDVSEGRFPDGSPNITTLTTPTPRAPNIGSGGANNPPTLAAIANRSLILGQTLSFTASATDPDAGQTISYSLLSGFPAGASINSSSGLFHWTPSAGQAPSVNSITVRATDNGSPVMSDSKSFSVTVSLPPTITITQSGANVSLTFATVVGKHYQVQYKNSLSAPTWTPLPLPPSGDLSFQATDTSKIVIDTPGGTRFYRIVALD